MTADGSSSSGLAATSRILSLAVGLALLPGCAAVIVRGPEPSPRASAAELWARLSNERSFGFRYNYRTDAPIGLSAQLAGVRDNAGRESWSGWSGRRDDPQRVELRAAGTDQYELRDGRWEHAERGTETRILEQAAAVVSGDSLRLVDHNDRRLVYAFEPLAPIINPGRTKQLQGVLEVDRRSGLPLRIACHDSARTALLEIRFGRFGRAGRVGLPFAPVQRLSLRPGSNGRRADVRRADDVLRARFDRLGWPYRLTASRQGWTLQLGRAVPPAELALVLAVGRVELHLGEWAAESMPSGGHVVNVGGDAARRVAVGGLLAANRQLSATADLSLPMSPTLVVDGEALRGVGTGEQLVALVVDGSVPGVANLRQMPLRFGDVGNSATVRILAVLTENAPLPFDLQWDYLP